MLNIGREVRVYLNDLAASSSRVLDPLGYCPWTAPWSGKARMFCGLCELITAVALKALVFFQDTSNGATLSKEYLAILTELNDGSKDLLHISINSLTRGILEAISHFHPVMKWGVSLTLLTYDLTYKTPLLAKAFESGSIHGSPTSAMPATVEGRLLFPVSWSYLHMPMISWPLAGQENNLTRLQLHINNFFIVVVRILDFTAYIPFFTYWSGLLRIKIGMIQLCLGLGLKSITLFTTTTSNPWRIFADQLCYQGTTACIRGLLETLTRVHWLASALLIYLFISYDRFKAFELLEAVKNLDSIDLHAQIVPRSPTLFRNRWLNFLFPSFTVKTIFQMVHGRATLDTSSLAQEVPEEIAPPASNEPSEQQKLYPLPPVSWPYLHLPLIAWRMPEATQPIS